MKLQIKLQNLVTILIIFGAIKIGRVKTCDPLSNDITRQCFKKEIIVSIPHSPNQIAVDHRNNVYFSFDSGQGEYLPAKKKIGSRTISVLKGIKDAFALATDPDTGIIYFGGSHGIYKYNPYIKVLKRLVVPNLDIWWLVIHKKDLYFIKFPSLNAYWYNNKTVKFLKELHEQSVHQFVFDLDNNIFFINSTGLYGVKRDDTNPVLLRDTPRFLGIAADKNGYVYVCSEDGIFVISRVVHRVKRVINVQGVLGITFDNDNNLIYSDSHEIIRLRPLSNLTYYRRDNAMPNHGEDML